MESKLSAKQERFCQEFCIDFNAARAARSAGYSAKTARHTGSENLTKPDIKNRIAQLLKELSMQPYEIKKRLSDIARGDIGDYIITRPSEYTPKVKKGLQLVISSLQDTVKFENDYAELVKLDGKELKAHQKAQKQRERLIVRFQLELKANPDAFRIVNGETQLIDQPELDVIAIARDKEKGKIKSFKQTKDGIQVELYPADAALTNLARVYSMFVDKSEVDVDIKGKLEGLSEEQLDEVLNTIIEKIENNGKESE